jgi:hypothetical protein
MTQEVMNRMRTEGGLFYCTNGHGQRYAKSENQKLKDELAREKQRHEQREASLQGVANQYKDAYQAASNRERAQKAAKTRIKNRIGNGVCPCCTRTFQNLQRHMEHMHPEFKQAE